MEKTFAKFCIPKIKKISTFQLEREREREREREIMNKIIISKVCNQACDIAKGKIKIRLDIPIKLESIVD